MAKIRYGELAGPRGRAAAPKAAFVYFIRSGGSVKIGLSDNPVERLRALQTANPVELELIGSLQYESREAAESAERAFHEQFAALRVRGEWYRLDAKHLSSVTGDACDVVSMRGFQVNRYHTSSYRSHVAMDVLDALRDRIGHPGNDAA